MRDRIERFIGGPLNGDFAWVLAFAGFTLFYVLVVLFLALTA